MPRLEFEIHHDVQPLQVEAVSEAVSQKSSGRHRARHGAKTTTVDDKSQYLHKIYRKKTGILYITPRRVENDPALSGERSITIRTYHQSLNRSL